MYGLPAQTFMSSEATHGEKAGPGKMPDAFNVGRAHIFYRSRVMDMNDDLPKFVDLPKEAGGSGEMFKSE